MATFSNNLATENGKKKEVKFYCECCDYKCYKKYNWESHLQTAKHLKTININNLATENGKNGKKMANNCCENCGKEYNDRTGLWRHKQKCNTNEPIVESNNNQTSEIQELKEFMKYLVQENSEMKTLMFEVIKNGTHNTTNNTTNNTNSHNKAFNLNFFLNETCKDAMNIMDFVDSIKVQLSDLERVGELGYIEGISNIILKNLKELDVTQRPVHCTDKKRETMYVKDHDKWEKDDEKLKLHKVVRKVTCKNQNLIPKFKEMHPDYNKYHSKVSDQYNKIIVESMGGSGDNDFEKEEKIIKNISKQVFIEKEETL
jgi:hypothetical protein